MRRIPFISHWRETNILYADWRSEAVHQKPQNRAPPKTEIQFRTDPIPQAQHRLMPALPKCPKSYWISCSPPTPSYAFLYLTTSRQEIWMMYKGSVSNQFRIPKSEAHFTRNGSLGKPFFSVLPLNMLCTGTKPWHQTLKKI